eukprot:c20598_g1_i2.p1 GENE.c20598_g1_i2~~c20598_g1_i2.p1  ORF type:complete len:519 (+),score=212.04 c20598_g1_i2:48-1604(+)
MDDEVNRINLFLRRENLKFNAEPKKLPVTIITGFLGSGKTTLVNNILLNKQNIKFGVAVNDYARVNIDSDTISNKNPDKMIALTDGCVCCTIKEEFSNAVALILQEEAHLRGIDYLLVETSGVSDPLAIIEALEAKFGRLFHARLDSVVAVVDTDDIYSKITENSDNNVNLPQALQSQLFCSDIVLLNKIDLFNEPSQIQKVKEYLQGLLPNGVKFIECSQGNVKLEDILGISETQAKPVGGVPSHDQGNLEYKLVDDLRSVRESRIDNSKDLKSKFPQNHLQKDQLNSFVFESEIPFSLRKWQNWIAENIPEGLVRMKGTIWFQEDEKEFSNENKKTNLWDFHFSGRKRIETIKSSFSGQKNIRLVLIGKSLKSEEIIPQLNDCLYKEENSIVYSNEEIEKYENLLKENFGRFEYKKINSDGILIFRLVSALEFGVSIEDLERKFGVFLNTVNLELSRAINFDPSPVFVTPVTDEVGSVWIRYHIGGNEKLWPFIENQAQRMIASKYQNVKSCSCGW